MLWVRTRVWFAVGWLALSALAVAAAESRWDAELAEFAAADRANPPAGGGVLFVGSSSIRLWKSLSSDFPELRAVNRGFGGSQIADVLEHFEVLVTPHAPRLVVFYAGTNDLAAGKSSAEVAADFEKFCARLHAGWPASRVIFLSIVSAPSRAGLRKAMQETNRLIAEFCARDARRQFVDVNSPLFDAAGNPRGELFQADQLHLASAGYALWRATLAPILGATKALPANGAQVTP